MNRLENAFSNRPPRPALPSEEGSRRSGPGRAARFGFLLLLPLLASLAPGSVHLDGVLPGALSTVAWAEGVDRTVPFELGKWIDLDHEEGPVTLHRLRIAEDEGGFRKSRLLRPGRNSAYTQDIEISIEYSNDATRDWEARIELEWIDSEGRVIDGYGSKENMDEGDRHDMLTASQSTLRYGLEQAKKLRIRIQAVPD